MPLSFGTAGLTWRGSFLPVNYYNEHDPKAAAWLRELIARWHIAPGVVDERSIEDITPSELAQYAQCHFFAGIGGWPLALRLSGWPDDKPVWTGSCPCQPFSTAGKGKGVADERHLWPAFKWLIDKCQPPVVFGEQVASKDGREWLAGVRADLEDMGFAVGAADLCAASVGAPHIRQRLFWVAYNQSQGRAGVESERQAWERIRPWSGSSCADGGLVPPDSTGRQQGQLATAPAGHGYSAESTSDTRGMGDSESERSQVRKHIHGEMRREGLDEGCKLSFWSDADLIPCRDGKSRRIEAGTFPLAHGVSGRVGLLRGYGNAIVPKVAAQFIQACEEAITA